jgi:uncharacterized membrane protein
VIDGSCSMCGMMGSFMAWILGLGVLVWLLVLVVLVLLAVWLFQQVRRAADDQADSAPPGS